MRRRPPVTLLMPNHNNGPLLEAVLGRLAENTTYSDYELIVVDDGSTDNSRDVLRRWRSTARISELTLIERRYGGVVEALNAGLRAASGELVVQLDGDATLETPGWLETLVDFHALDARIGVVCPLVTFEDGRIQAAGTTIVAPEGLHDRGTRPLEPTGQRTLHTRAHRPPATELASLLKWPAEVDAAVGVCMLYAREMAEELGGYDPGFSPVWFDDLDLCLSARRLGLKVFYVPGPRVVHRLSRRNPRDAASRATLLRARLRRAVAPVTSEPVRRLLRRGDGFSAEQLRRLESHRAHWRGKWGFDLLNPDLDAVRRRWADTELMWAYDPERRAVGEDIAARWSSSSS